MTLKRTLAALAAALVSSAAPAGASLVAYWPFNSAATLGADAAGVNTLTATGATWTASGKSGGGLALSGATQYLAGTVTNLPIGNSAYTQAAWFKPTQLGARGIVGWGNYGTSRQVNALRIYDSGNGFRHYWWGADLDALNLSTNFLDGNWHHVAATYDGTTRRVYLDGVQVAQDTPGANNASAANFRIGSTNNGEFFSGTLDDVYIYNNALSASEVATLAAGAGPAITSFTVNKASAYEGEAVTLNWNVDTSRVTGTYGYELKYGATVINSGTTATGSFNTTVPDLAGTPQTVTWTFRAIETGGSGLVATATAGLSGNPGIPTANGQTGLNTPVTSPLNITLTGSDPNGGTLTYTIVTPPAHGTVSPGTGAPRTYTPTPDIYGADQFTFKVSDGKYESAPATVRLTVLTPPLAPTGITLDDTTIRPENVAGDFLSNISSPDPNAGEPHTFTLVSGAGSEENGNFTISGHQLRANTSFAALTGVPQRIRIRSTDQGSLSVEASFILTVQPKTRRVVINEIHYNGSNNSVRNSFIELYNDTAAAVNLTGWRITGGVDYLFPSGTTLAPDSYLLVSEDPATMQSYYGKTALGPWDNAVIVYPDGSKETTGLSNDGDTVRLRDASNNVVCEVDYGNHSPWPSEGNGEGSSIELINPGLDASHGSNWAAAKAPGSGPALTTYIPFASTWRWRKGVQGDTGEPAAQFTSWRFLNFTEPAVPAANAQWQDNQTPIGFGDNDNNTANNLENTTTLTDMSGGALYTSIYMRKTFTIPAGQLPSAIQISTKCDDGCIVWINGIYAGAIRPNAAIGTGHHYYNSLGVNAPEPAPTETLAIVNAASVNLVEGTNVIAIHAMNTAATSTDFFIDAEVKQAVAATADVASPGARNLKFSAVAAPAIRKIEHTPLAPLSTDPIVITAKITDPNGVATASLAYQIVTAGNYIPSTLPKAVSGGAFVNPTTPLDPNPAFELPANWTTVAMNDDGLGDDALGGDGIWTATIAPQANRTLVRYRITTTDNNGASVRVPTLADPSLNFACFVYNGVPAYQGTSAADLQKVPVYHFLTRQADYDQCVAYGSGNANRLNGSSPSWQFENWEGCFVSNGVVYDHLPYRLKGANGRYWASGNNAAGNYAKRAFKFLFHKGYEFDARDEAGNGHPGKWSTMITENCWENRATYTFSINEIVNFRIWNKLGVPAPLGNWAHFRSIMQSAEQPDAWHGDFWGLMYVHEDYDRRFLKAHNLKKGNLYKLTRDGTGGLVQYRYQSTFGVTDGSDHDELFNNLRGTSTPAYITGRVNLDLWCRYHALAEAVRHYDYWPSGDNNAANYFYPNYNASNGNKGVMWWFPNDVDATWGPTWNGGQDLVHNSLFNDSGVTGGDASTNPALWPNYFNQIRELRRLVWQPDQINPYLDELADIIRPLVNADFQRWVGGPNDAGNFGGLAVYGPSGSATLSLNSGVTGQAALDLYIAGMKDFAFDSNGGGSVWPGGNLGAGGTAARLDTIANITNPLTSTLESAQYPNLPVITFTGGAGFPVNDLRFTTSAFSDPNGSAFAAIQWRMAEVNTSATYTPGVPRLLEITATHDSGERTTFAAEYKFPPTAAQPGKRYRARVRMKDATGRWSDWSNPAEFTAGAFDPSAYASQIVVSEIMYHATGATAAERAVAAAQNPAQSWNDDSFDYVELRNVSANPVDLTGFQFTQGVDFVFPAGTVVAPGANILIVANTVAFNTRYGTGKPVVGAWDENDKLSNGGELLTLQFGLSIPAVFSFAYDDDPVTNWPTAPDGDGPALIRIAPEDTARDPGNGLNWRSGPPSPGTGDGLSYADWLAGAAEPDADSDGLSNIVEYMLGGNTTSDSSSLTPVGGFQQFVVNGTPGTYVTLTFRRVIARQDFTQHVEFGTDMTSWPIAAVQATSVDNGDGTRTEVWRSANPVTAGSRLFGRIRFTQP